MMLLWRIIKWPLIIICLLAFFLYVLVFTPSGAGMVLQTLTKIFPKELSLGRYEAKSLFDVTLYDVAWNSSTTTANAKQITLKWTPKWWTQDKRWLIREFTIVSARVQQQAESRGKMAKPRTTSVSENSTESFDLTKTREKLAQLNLFRVDLLNLNNIEWRDAKKNHLAVNVKISRERSSVMMVQNCSVEWNKTTFTCEGKVDDNWHVHWKISRVDLQTVDRDVKGKLAIAGQIAGPFFFPTLSTEWRIPELQIGDDVYVRNVIASGVVQSTSSSWNTRITLKPANLLMPKFGVDVQLSSALVQYQPSQPLHINAEARAGTGQLHVRGTWTLEDAHPRLQMKLTGKNALLVNTVQYHAQVDPNVTFNWENGKGKLEGTVDVSEARFSPSALKLVTVLPDEVEWVNPEYVEFQQSQSSVLDQLTVNLQVKLGDRVELEDPQMKAKLGGKVLVFKSPGGVWRGNGVIELRDGQYQAYGSLLKLERGRLIYTGNAIDNPALDVLAVKQIESAGTTSTSMFGANQIQTVSFGNEEVTVGVSLSGFLQKPTVRLYSNPSGLSQAQIISYLAAGQSSIQGAGGAGSALLGPLQSFLTGKSGAQGINNQLQSFFGDISLGSRDYVDPTQNSVVNAASLNISKPLSPRLSLHYSVGLFVPVSEFSLRYKLNEHWSVQTESSALENGIDLFYQYEK